MNTSVSCIMLAQIGRESYIKRAIQQFQAQTVVGAELIIVHSDNEQFDGWLRSLTTYIDSHIIRCDSGATLGFKRNLAVKTATRQYVATFDDDDYHHPRRLEFQLQVLKNRIGFTAVSRYIHLFEQEKTAYLIRLDVTGIADRPWCIIEPSLMVSRKLVERIGFGNVSIGEDSDLIRTLYQGGWFIPHGSESFENGGEYPIIFGYVCTGNGVMSKSHHTKIVDSATKLVLADTNIDKWFINRLDGYRIGVSEGIHLISGDHIALYY